MRVQACPGGAALWIVLQVNSVADGEGSFMHHGEFHPARASHGFEHSPHLPLPGMLTARSPAFRCPEGDLRSHSSSPAGHSDPVRMRRHDPEGRCVKHRRGPVRWHGWSGAGIYARSFRRLKESGHVVAQVDVEHYAGAYGQKGNGCTNCRHLVVDEPPQAEDG